MIFDNIITLTVILLVIWILDRWGVAIFTLYALVHFVAGQWLEVGIAFAIAFYLSVVQGLVSWFAWAVCGRAAWLATLRFRQFPIC